MSTQRRRCYRAHAGSVGINRLQPTVVKWVMIPGVTMTHKTDTASCWSATWTTAKVEMSSCCLVWSRTVGWPVANSSRICISSTRTRCRWWAPPRLKSQWKSSAIAACSMPGSTGLDSCSMRLTQKFLCLSWSMAHVWRILPYRQLVYQRDTSSRRCVDRWFYRPAVDVRSKNFPCQTCSSIFYVSSKPFMSSRWKETSVSPAKRTFEVLFHVFIF